MLTERIIRRHVLELTNVSGVDIAHVHTGHPAKATVWIAADTDFVRRSLVG